MNNNVEVEKILARVFKEKTHRVDVQDLRPPSQQALVVVHHVGDVLPVQSRLLFVESTDLLVALSYKAFHDGSNQSQSSQA